VPQVGEQARTGLRAMDPRPALEELTEEQTILLHSRASPAAGVLQPYGVDGKIQIDN
jgi:hypothetical protein